MTKSFHIVVFLIVPVICGCSSSSVSEDNKGVMYKDIPSTAYSVAENDSVIVFLNDEAKASGDEPCKPMNPYKIDKRFPKSTPFLGM